MRGTRRAARAQGYTRISSGSIPGHSPRSRNELSRASMAPGHLSCGENRKASHRCSLFRAEEPHLGQGDTCGTTIVQVAEWMTVALAR